MLNVNKQLAIFFKQVGIRNYPKKSIAFILAAYFVFIIQFAVIQILKFYIEISNIYFWLGAFLQNIIYQALFLTITASFYYLADFGFEARINQEQQTYENEGFNANINMTRLSDNADVSLLGESALEICYNYEKE